MKSIQFFENIIRDFEKIFVEFKDVKVKFKSNDFFCGMCVGEPYGEYYFIGKMRYKLTKTKSIILNQQSPNIVFTFLHECSHVITPQYERKVKNEWIRLDHSDKFYVNFMKIIEIANHLGIIELRCTIKELKKLDDSNANTKSDLARFTK
jgi:hypothetical protein